MKSSLRDIQAIEAAAHIAQSGAPELLRAEEAKVLTELVGAFNSGKLSDRDAAIGVAVIARIRRVNNDLQRAINKGTDAGLKLR